VKGTGKIKVRTKLDAERLKKVQGGEVGDFMDQVAQKDEAKAAEFIKEKGKESDDLELLNHYELMEKTKREMQRTDQEYINYLASLVYALCLRIDWPKGWVWRIDVQKSRFALYFKSSSGRIYGRGIKPVHDAKYDLNAVNLLGWYAENTVDKLTHVTESGIIIPHRESYEN
jgi:hypothetical protein